MKTETKCKKEGCGGDMYGNFTWMVSVDLPLSMIGTVGSNSYPERDGDKELCQNLDKYNSGGGYGLDGPWFVYCNKCGTKANAFSEEGS